MVKNCPKLIFIEIWSKIGQQFTCHKPRLEAEPAGVPRPLLRFCGGQTPYLPLFTIGPPKVRKDKVRSIIGQNSDPQSVNLEFCSEIPSSGPFHSIRLVKWVWRNEFSDYFMVKNGPKLIFYWIFVENRPNSGLPTNDNSRISSYDIHHNVMSWFVKQIISFSEIQRF